VSNGDTDQSETLLVPSVLALSIDGGISMGVMNCLVFNEAEDNKEDSHETFKRYSRAHS
jgi:hypothetical protein